MRVKVAALALIAAMLPLMIWPVVKPMWPQYTQVVHDCVDTPKHRRTPKQ